MVRGSHARFALAVTVALLLAAAVPAFAQLQTGNVYGTVKDEQGQALPGVTVTLEGVGAPQIQVTDEQGLFRFLNLYPGQYSVKTELDGFSPVEYPDVVVRVGSNANMEITMNAAVTDVITVTGESPILDERKVNQGANVTTVIDNLEKTGLVARRHCTEDRRVTYIDLTAAGREQIRRSVGSGSTVSKLIPVECCHCRGAR